MGRRHRGKKKVFKFTSVAPGDTSGSAAKPNGKKPVAPATASAASHPHHDHSHPESCAAYHEHCAAHHKNGVCSSNSDEGGCDNHGMVTSEESTSGSAGYVESEAATYGGSSSSNISKTLKHIFGNRTKFCAARRSGPEGEIELVGMDFNEGTNGYKCALPMGQHGLQECLNKQLCDLCYVSCIRNLDRPDKLAAISFRVPGVRNLPVPHESDDEEFDVEYRIDNPKPHETEDEDNEDPESLFVTFSMSLDCKQDDDEEDAEDGDDEDDEEEEDNDDLSVTDEDSSSELEHEDENGECTLPCGPEYCEAHKPKNACKGCPPPKAEGRGEKLLRGMKDWRPAHLTSHDQQFVLRQAKKYHVDATVSRLLQFVLHTLKKGDDDGMPAKQIPKFARKKITKRKLLGRSDFPKYEIPDKELEYMARPYAYLELLDHNTDDGILLVSLADMIGIPRMRDEMISVFDKNFGFDYRMEQLKEEEKKRHHAHHKPGKK